MAAPTVGVEAAAAAENAVAAEENEVNAMTVPDFKPFVMVRVPLPSGYTKGEVLGLNESNQAVGWMWNSSAGKAHPFLFTPPSTVDILDLPTGASAGQALGISDADPPVIVGSVYDDSEAFDVPVTWEADGDFGGYVYDDETPGYTFGVNADGRFVGEYKNPTNPNSFVFEGQSGWEPTSNTQGGARAVNADGEVVGWHLVSGDSHAYSWVENTTTDIHPEGWDESGATSINQYGDIAGWVIDDPDGPIPAYWYNTGSFYSFATPFPALGAESMVCGINSHGEMAVTRTDAAGAVIWQVYESADVSFNLSGVALMPDSTGQIASARAINDNLWIGGSYKATSGSDPVPCLVIPYDVDNDGNPDYREIVNEDEADTNGNWLIDWAESLDTGSAYEGMRVGLHAPGAGSSPAHLIQNNYAVRLQLFMGVLPVEAPEGEYTLTGVIASDCEDFREDIDLWSRDGINQREVVVWLRSALEVEDLDYDYLPASANDRASLLAELHTFGHLYARCIDYVQTGNEVFAGAGSYLIRDDDLTNLGHSGCGWTPPPDTATLEQIYGQSQTCFGYAVDEIINWLEDQAWAVLEGSALAGRPLRLIGPGMPHAIITDGYSGQGAGGARRRQYVDKTTDFVNRNQMCFDMHLHYEDPAEVSDAIDKLIDNGHGFWDPPNWRCALEWSPQATGLSGWSGTNGAQFVRFRDDEGCDPGPPVDCCWDDPGETWDEFVERWRDDETNGFSGDFGIDTALDAMAEAGFILACYGPTNMHAPSQIIFDMGTLRATRVCDDWMDPSRLTDNKRFTPLTDEFESWAAYFPITFPQNRQSCPTCPQ